MIDDEEYRARLKAFSDATGRTVAEFTEGMRRLTETIKGTASSMAELTAAADERDPR